MVFLILALVSGNIVVEGNDADDGFRLHTNAL